MATKTYPPGKDPAKIQQQLSGYEISPEVPHEYMKHPSPRAIGDLCICGKYLQDPIHLQEGETGGMVEENQVTSEQPLRTAEEIALGEQLNPALARMKAMARMADKGIGGAVVEKQPGTWGEIFTMDRSDGRSRIPIVDQAIELAALFPDGHPVRTALAEAAAEEFIRTVWPAMIVQTDETAGS